MSANSRLTVAIHALAWMELARSNGKTVVTSDQIAASVNTNPVVIRRLLGSLRAAGLVGAQRGPNAGWSLARRADQISLASVYGAMEKPGVFALHAAEPNQTCPVGRGIQPVLTRVYDGVGAALEHELAATTIADVLKETLASKAGTSRSRRPRSK
jgi:Rrf2 family protein